MYSARSLRRTGQAIGRRVARNLASEVRLSSSRLAKAKIVVPRATQFPRQRALALRGSEGDRCRVRRGES